MTAPARLLILTISFQNLLFDGKKKLTGHMEADFKNICEEVKLSKRLRNLNEVFGNGHQAQVNPYLIDAPFK